MLAKFGLALLLLGATSATAAEKLILSIDYGSVVAYQPYTTGYYEIENDLGPIQEIKIATIGEFCYLRSQAFWFVSDRGGMQRQAALVGSSAIINDQVFAIKYDFEQTRYTFVNCTIRFYAVTVDDDPSPPADLARVARDLHNTARLFAFDLEDNSDYVRVVPTIEAFNDKVDLLREAIETGRDSNIERAFMRLKMTFDEFSRAFYRAHADALNAQMLAGFDEISNLFFELNDLITPR